MSSVRKNNKKKTILDNLELSKYLDEILKI